MCPIRTWAQNRGEFIAAVLEGLPEAPQYFQHNAKLNHDGPELVEWEPKQLPWVEPSQDLTDATKHYVVDIRDASAYSAGHIPNSVAIGLRGRLETWVGIMVPWNAKLVLAGDEKDLREALFRLHRVGYRPQLLDINKWKAANLPLVTSEMIPPQKLHAQMQTAESPQVLDVRLPAEWMGLRIGTVINIPLSELSQRAGKLDRTIPVVAVCNSAYRSTLAVGILERAGFKKAASLAGGSEAWIEAGLPVFQAKSQGTASSVPQRQIKLAERMSAAELKWLMQDLPGTFQLVDIRTKEPFADFSLPGAENVDLADLLNNPSYLTGAGPLIVVDRDGSLAMMVAGILSQKTERPSRPWLAGCRPTGRKPRSVARRPRRLRPLRRRLPPRGVRPSPGCAESWHRSGSGAGQTEKEECGMLTRTIHRQETWDGHLAVSFLADRLEAYPTGR